LAQGNDLFRDYPKVIPRASLCASVGCSGQSITNEQNIMQSIQTKFLSATDSKGSRIKAKCARGSITIPFPHELTGDAIHRAAVMALVLRFLDEDESKGTPRETNFWNRAFVSGSLPDGSMAHVFLS
jgi:hypothetical protein